MSGNLSCLGLCLALVLVCASCGLLQRDEREGDPLIARVNDDYLYLSDVADLLKTAKTPEDTANVISNYVDTWVKKRLILDMAVKYLPQEDLDMEKRIQDYRESLLIYAYENELINQKMDTLVTNEQIRQYYDENPGSFELNEDILQFYYLKVSKEAPKLDTVRELFRMQTEEDKRKLVEYGFQYAKDFYLKDSIWYELNELYSQIPIELRQLKTMATNSLSGEVEDSNYIYLLKVNNYMPQRDLAPLDYVKENIKRIILNKRKMDLINSTYDNLYKDAVKSGSFEKYDTP